MTREEKIRKMFIIVNGKEVVEGRFSIEVDDEHQQVNVYKDGHYCWCQSFTDLLFEYATRKWND